MNQGGVIQKDSVDLEAAVTTNTATAARELSEKFNVVISQSYTN